MPTDYIDTFRAVIEEAGLRTDTIIADGKSVTPGKAGGMKGREPLKAV